jgi:hypothetical protein
MLLSNNLPDKKELHYIVASTLLGLINRVTGRTCYSQGKKKNRKNLESATWVA